MHSFWGEVCVHSGFFMLFLLLFYFTYVLFIQNQAFVNDLWGLIQEPIETLKLFDPSGVAQLGQKLKQIDASAMMGGSGWESQNNAIRTNVMIIMPSIAAVLIILGFFLQYHAGGSLFEMLLSNLIVLGFIAVTEFGIVGLFLSNFVEIDKEFVKAMLLYNVTTENAFGGQCDFVGQFLNSVLPSFLINLKNKLMGVDSDYRSTV